MATVKKLQIDGITVATPALEGVTFSPEKMHSSNTGRLATTGKMVGTIIAIKRTVKIKWPTLSAADAKAIDDIVSSTTFEHTLKLVLLDDTVATIKVYFGTPSYTLYSWADGLRKVTGVGVDAIEL